MADEYDLECTDWAMLCASERFHLFGGKLLLMLNDCFAWASADCEEVEPESVEDVSRLFRRYGDCGLYYWACKKRSEWSVEFKDVQRMIDFVRREEDLIASEPSSSKRAYMDLPKEASRG